METLTKLQAKLRKLQTKFRSFVAMKMRKQVISILLDILKIESLIDSYQNQMVLVVALETKQQQIRIEEANIALASVRANQKEQTMKNHKYVTIKGDKIYITSPYNGEFVTALKEAIIWKQRKWDGDSKSWVVNNNPENLEIINSLLAEYYVESTEWVTKRITGKVSATAKRTYLDNVFIDGCALYNLGYGQLRDGATFEIVRVDQDEFTRGDSRHAFKKEFDITVKCRENAMLKGNADFVDENESENNKSCCGGIVLYNYGSIINDELAAININNDNYEIIKPFISIGYGNKGKVTLAEIVKNNFCLASDLRVVAFSIDGDGEDEANAKFVPIESFVEFLTNDEIDF